MEILFLIRERIRNERKKEGKKKKANIYRILAYQPRIVRYFSSSDTVNTRIYDRIQLILFLYSLTFMDPHIIFVKITLEINKL